VGKINGHCTGGGVGLAAACDLSVIRSDAQAVEGVPQSRDICNDGNEGKAWKTRKLGKIANII